MRRRFYWWAMAVCVTAGFLSFVPRMRAHQKGNSLIVPGKSVGEIALGMEDPEVEKRLGKPTVGDAATGRYWGGWFGKRSDGGRGPELDVRSGHSAEHDKNAAATAIRVESSFFHTAEGINTQSTLAKIWEAFPELRYCNGDRDDKAVETYADDAHGIAFEVRRTDINAGVATVPPGESWGVCQAIIVYAPDKDRDGPPGIRSMRDMPAND